MPAEQTADPPGLPSVACSSGLDAPDLTEQVRGAFDLEIHGAVRNLGPDNSLEEGKRLLVPALRAHQLPERQAGLCQEHQILGGDSGVDGITESGLGELLEPPCEQLSGTLEVFAGLHTGRERGG